MYKGKESKELPQKYLNVLEDLEWTVVDYTDDGRVELQKYSPAGEDFFMCVGVDDFTREVRNYYDDFDVEEHVALWINAKEEGVSGIPSIMELCKDAEEIRDMIWELMIFLEGVDIEERLGD